MSLTTGLVILLLVVSYAAMLIAVYRDEGRSLISTERSPGDARAQAPQAEVAEAWASGTVFCPSCHTPNDPAFVYCEECIQKLPRVRPPSPLRRR